MTDLPNVLPLPSVPSLRPSVADEDARAVLRGLAPGWYVVRDLYSRYEVWAKAQGQEPASRASLGMALKRITASRNAHNHASAYEVTTELSLGEA